MVWLGQFIGVWTFDEGFGVTIRKVWDIVTDDAMSNSEMGKTTK